MDAVLFRSAQKVENLQIRAELAATKAKDLLILHFQQGKILLLNVWNSVPLSNIKQVIKEDALKLNELRLTLAEKFNPKEVYDFLLNVLSRKWTKRDLYLGCSGLVIGCFIGIIIGLSMRKQQPIVRYMEAVQCSHYKGVESVTVIEDAIAPYDCHDHDVLVDVKAASVQIIDTLICCGYGRTYRRILRNLNEDSPSDLPVTLGRDCTGVIVDIGGKVKRLEIGDEVWLTVPFWAQGTLSQSVLVSENRVSRKPKNIGFEGACSIPYAGSLALSALNQVNVNCSNAQKMEILVLGGCTPVGCVLIQILNHWGSTVTATCYKRAVPVVKALGAKKLITQTEPQEFEDCLEPDGSVQNCLLKELLLKNHVFDAIINTTEVVPDFDSFKEFVRDGGGVASTVPPVLATDSCGLVTRYLLYGYIWLRYKLQSVIGLPVTSPDETHLCYINLDRLTELVEDGHIQTVVDKVCQPRDIDAALRHIRSPQSIGSTIVTFR